MYGHGEERLLAVGCHRWVLDAHGTAGCLWDTHGMPTNYRWVGCSWAAGWILIDAPCWTSARFSSGFSLGVHAPPPVWGMPTTFSLGTPLLCGMPIGFSLARWMLVGCRQDLFFFMLIGNSWAACWIFMGCSLVGCPPAGFSFAHWMLMGWPLDFLSILIGYS